jgi:hypothetical protein
MKLVIISIVALCFLYNCGREPLKLRTRKSKVVPTSTPSPTPSPSSSLSPTPSPSPTKDRKFLKDRNLEEIIRETQEQLKKPLKSIPEENENE